MVRPCFLVIDREYSGSISTRKLVIETAKFNVVTAYSGAEAVATLQKYPAVDGIVMDARTPDVACAELAASLKRVRPDTPIVVVGSSLGDCGPADHYLDSFNPKQLLDLLQELQPEQTARIEKRNDELSKIQP